MFATNLSAASWSFPLAALGVASSIIETIATSVGAGILLGGFFAGTAAMLDRNDSRQRRVAGAGYVGGWLALVALLVDLLVLLLR